MRSWKLNEDAPLFLTLAANARVTSTTYPNDIIWALQLHGGEPPALAVTTTFGLRAAQMRLFPIFRFGQRSVHDPAEFHRPPQVTQILPGYLSLTLSPFEGVDVQLEYRVDSSQTLTGRVRVLNRSVLAQEGCVDWAGVLDPLGYGVGLGVLPVGLNTILHGNTGDLAVVVFVSGGIEPGKGVYPSLCLPINLYPGGSIAFHWAVSAAADTDQAFEQAREATMRSWDAATARIELQTTADFIEVVTSQPEWDALFWQAQVAAVSLLQTHTDALPEDSFVLTRRPDQGYSTRGDGSDYPYLWSGQTAFDSLYFLDVLPGIPDLGKRFLRNFAAAVNEEGVPVWKPGLGGQRSSRLALPLLTQLYDLTSLSQEETETFFPILFHLIQAWLDYEHDRDQDALPEYQHPLQTMLENHPLFDLWHPSAQGMSIEWVESPALGAMLVREVEVLLSLARRLGRGEEEAWLEAKAALLNAAVQSCWDHRSGVFRYRDMQSHRSPAARELLAFHGSGVFKPKRQPLKPQRLVVQLTAPEAHTLSAIVHIRGVNAVNERVQEEFSPREISWHNGVGRLTTRNLFARVEEISVSGVPFGDQGRVLAAGLDVVDISLFLPLWAGVVKDKQAKNLVQKTLFRQMLRRFGLPVLMGKGKNSPTPAEGQAVSLPWNALIAHSLLDWGMRREAADLFGRFLQPALEALKTRHTFFQYYHAETGAPMGEAGHLWGIPPLRLFLRIAGIEKIAPQEVEVSGFNAFPFPVTVKYQRISVTREGDTTTVRFPGHPAYTVTGSEARRISLT
ncbi:MULTISPECIES: MGH1-like glycoside hydrolase domain-containing protein [Anaerolinea]|uniref:MGH1-like glycoside hydrolase domain-containing protein n=1 Tax=Anaerolinea TaxID=233189 RepID=UPI0026150183|nr:hypothetical protein [Anaerolinea thermophila]